MNHKITDFIRNPFLIFNWLGAKGLLDWMDDRNYLKLRFRASTGMPLELENPKTFSEKIQWLKLYNRNPKYKQMVDKIAVKDFVSGIIGEEYIIPTLAVYEKVEDIDITLLPDRFVLKCSHDSGGIVICRDKAMFDRHAAFKKLRHAMARDYYKWCREYPYKDVPHRILAEQYIGNGNSDLWDYKLMCYNGKCRQILVCTGRDSGNLCFDFFDLKWNHLPFINDNRYGNANYSIPIPQNLETMILLADKLSKAVNTPFCRIDLYNTQGKIYFGEITFSPIGGFGQFAPPEWDCILGNMIHLDNCTKP